MAKKHVFGSAGAVAGKGCQTLACALVVMLLRQRALQLTARQYGEVVLPDAAPSRSRYFSQKAVTVQGGYGVVFAVQVQVL